MYVAILLGAFVTVTLFILGLYLLINERRIRTLSRLERYTQNDQNMEELSALNHRNVKEKLIEVVGELGKILPQHNSYSTRHKEKLAKAAILMKPEEFFGISVLMALGIGLLIYIVTINYLWTIMALILSFFIPEVIVNRVKKQRMKKLNAQLPDALSIIANGIRAGFSINQAIAMVNKEMLPPISDEFTKVLKDNTLGKPLEEALNNMSERTEDEDLDMFITSLLIQRQVGGNLAEVLETISHTIRERVRIKGEIRSLTAQGRISAVIVTLLPVVLAVVISVINPGYLDIMYSRPIGVAMLIGAIFFILIGHLVLRKITDIRV